MFSYIVRDVVTEDMPSREVERVLSLDRIVFDDDLESLLASVPEERIKEWSKSDCIKLLGLPPFDENGWL